MRDFTPTLEKPDTKLTADTKISVWRWLHQAVKLWRALFDESRKERGSLSTRWHDSEPNYVKCALMSRCLQYPRVMQVLARDQKDDNKTKTAKQDELTNKCTAWCREVPVRVEDCTSPSTTVANTGCSKPVDSNTSSVELNKRLSPDTVTALWCDPSKDGFYSAVHYAAQKAAKLRQRTRLIGAVQVHLTASTQKKPVVNGQAVKMEVSRIDAMNPQSGSELAELSEVKSEEALKELWTHSPKKIGAIVVRLGAADPTGGRPPHRTQPVGGGSPRPVFKDMLLELD